MRVYSLMISTPDGKPYITLTEKDNYQIVTSISTVDIENTNTFNIIEIYNANSIFTEKDLSGYSIIFECGYEEDGISKLQGFDTKKIMKKPILKSYIWDIIDDFSSPPENKVIIRAYPIPKNNINTNNTGNNISILFKKNTYLFDFVKDFMNQYSNSEIIAITDNIKTISNKTNDLTFTYNPNDLGVLNSLNLFIRTFCKNNSKVPLSIIATTSGYVLGYDVNNSLPSNIESELISSFNTLDQFTLDTQMIIKPPSFQGPTIIQLQTILLPSIKVGSILNIKENVAVQKTTDIKFNKNQKATGLWYVKSVSYNVSIYDSAPAAFSNIMELIKITF